MTVYAKCPNGNWVYLTGGKLYPVHNDDGVIFEAVCDTGDTIRTLWRGTSHLYGGDWERVEINEDVKPVIDWTKPIEWVSSSGSIEKVLEVRSSKGGSFPKIAVVGSGQLYCYDDGRICVDDCGYLRNIAEPEIALVDTSPTLRDQFAMAALASIDETVTIARDAALWAYEVADEMIKARKVNNEAA